MKTKLSISDKFLSIEDSATLDSLLPSNIHLLKIEGVETVKKYDDSYEITLVINPPTVVGRRYLSLLTSQKDIVRELEVKQFQDLSREMRLDLIKQILKNSKSYLKQPIFNS